MSDAVAMRTLILFAFLVVAAARAGIPAGGMDLVADHWLDESEESRPRFHHEGAFGEGPLRLSLYGVSIGGIGNNTATASTNAGIFATERHLAGRFYSGGSFGQGSSSTVKWSHGEIHGGALLTDQFAVRLGYNSDQYDYPGNGTAAKNVIQDALKGPELGADVFGSPAYGWYVQISGDLLPLKQNLTDGTVNGTNGFTVRGSFLVGTSIFYNLDLSLLAVAVPRLGDNGSNVFHVGLGASLTF